MKIGKLVKINELTVNQSYPHPIIEYIDTSSAQDGVIIDQQILALKDAPSRARRIVRKNDILISTVRPALRHYAVVCEPKPNTVASTGFAVITAKTIHYKYLYYYLTTKWYTEYLSMIAESQQSNFPAFNPSLIETTDISLPSNITQQKIAAILSAYDDLIENNKRRIALLEKMAEEIYREWFVRMRFPGHEKVKLVKGVPSGWEIRKLGSVLELCYGKALKEDDRVPGEFHVYGSGGIVGTHNKALVKTPGLIVGRKGNVGSVYWSDRGFFPIDTVYFVKSELPNSFLYFLLHSMNFINNDAAVPGLNRSQAYANQFFLPHRPLIDRYAAIVNSHFEMKRILTRQNERLIATRDLLLPRLISGKLSVENLDIKFPPGMEEELKEEQTVDA